MSTSWLNSWIIVLGAHSMPTTPATIIPCPFLQPNRLLWVTSGFNMGKPYQPCSQKSVSSTHSMPKQLNISSPRFLSFKDTPHIFRTIIISAPQPNQVLLFHISKASHCKSTWLPPWMLNKDPKSGLSQKKCFQTDLDWSPINRLLNNNNNLELTFDPELVNVCFHGSGFKSDTSEGEEEQSEEENGPTVPLDTASEMEQLRLEPRPDPKRLHIPSRFALQEEHWGNINDRLQQHQCQIISLFQGYRGQSVCSRVTEISSVPWLKRARGCSRVPEGKRLFQGSRWQEAVLGLQRARGCSTSPEGRRQMF